MVEHVLRLLPGEDFLETVDNYCLKHNIEAAFIGTCVGGLSQVTFRKGVTRERLTLKGNYEIVSMEGTVSKGGTHIHASVSDIDFNVRGGHLTYDTIVQTTAELVIIELESYELSRSKDLLSGYKSLKVRIIKEAKDNGN
ncbi:MAG TPA: PPC domain-containing DNA-binding protein [Erysipelothrix sp.]|nr:PPC domain-containing DNA-binding protein [Erysipelothrix sp.]